MASIITRSALLAWGQTPPPDLAMIVRDWRGERQVVTWADRLAQRRARQREILARKRHVRPWRAYRLSVVFYDQWLFGGWQTFLETYTGACVWIDRDRSLLRPTLMQMYPLVLTFGDGYAHQCPDWERWKAAFAQQYARRRHHRKPVGVTYVWWDGRDGLRHITERPCIKRQEAPCPTN